MHFTKCAAKRAFKTHAHTHTHSYLFFHVCHLHRGLVPQLVRHPQVHLNPFVYQILQGRHGLTGALQTHKRAKCQSDTQTEAIRTT